MTPLAAHIPDYLWLPMDKAGALSMVVALTGKAIGDDVTHPTEPVELAQHRYAQMLWEQALAADEENRKLARLSDEIGGK